MSNNAVSTYLTPKDYKKYLERLKELRKKGAEYIRELILKDLKITK